MSDNDIHAEADTGADTRTETRNSARETDRALFRAHAVARLRGDTPEALRLALQIGEEKRMAHLLYVLYLFTRTVYDEFGDTPDPCDLAELTRLLHERHYRPGSGFWAIRSEAMVRGVCGESALLTEVPVAEQPMYMWAVIGELVDPEVTDAQIAEALDRAEALEAEIVRAGWDSLFTELPAPRRAPEPGSEALAPTRTDSRDDRTGTGDPTGYQAGDRTDIRADEETDA
jgi:hypothetical protein